MRWFCMLIAFLLWLVAGVIVLVNGHWWKPPIGWFLMGAPFFALAFLVPEGTAPTWWRKPRQQ